MKKIKNLIIPFILVLLIIGANSCIKDNFDFDRLSGEIHYEPSLAAPIAYGNLSLVDVINSYDSKKSVQTNDDGFLSIFYSNYAESDTVTSIMNIGNQQVSASVSSTEIDFTGFNNAGDVLTVNHNINLSFNLFNSEAEIDSIWLNSGLLNMVASSTYEHGIQLTITFPSLIKNGDAFSDVLNLLPYGSTDESANNNMNGYHLDLTQTALSYNEIPIEIEIKLVHSGGNNTGQLNLDIDLLEPNHEAMFGYFGHNTLIFNSGKIALDVFDNDNNWMLNDFWFEDPKFKVNYNNSYGIPINFYFDSVKAYSVFYDQYYNLNEFGAGLPMDSLNPHYISYPITFETSINDSLLLDKNNSNFREVIQQRPFWIKFITHAHTNPEGDAGHNNFVYSGSKFRADLEVELPIWGYVDRFNGIDTIDLNLAEQFENPDIIERLLLRLNIDNGLPVSVISQAYFLDENQAVIDSLIQSSDIRLLESATVDNNGQVISKTNKTIDLEMTGERLEQIMDTKYILYKASASTPGADEAEVIKIYPDYEVDFNLAIEADLDIEVNLDTLNNN